MKFPYIWILISLPLVAYSQGKKHEPKEIFNPDVSWAYEASQVVELKNIKPAFFPIDSILKDQLFRHKITGYDLPEKNRDLIRTTGEITNLYNIEPDTSDPFYYYIYVRGNNNLLYLKQLFFFDEKKNELCSKIEAAGPVIQKYDKGAYNDTSYYIPLFYTSLNSRNIRTHKKDRIARISNTYALNTKEKVLKQMFNKDISEILIDKIHAGQLKAYGLHTKNQLSKDEIDESMGNFEIDSLYIEDPISREKHLKTIKTGRQFFKLEFVGYHIIQDLYYNKKRNSFTTKILAVCPLVRVLSPEEYYKDKIFWLFWIAFNGYDPKKDIDTP